MNKKIVRKLITLGFTVFLTSFTLISSTYAFIILRRDAGIEDFTFGVKAVEGLQLSLDGKNFSQDISYDQIAVQIGKNVDAKNNSGKQEEHDADYYKNLFYGVKFNGVTPKADETPKDGVRKVLYNGTVPQFVKDKLIPLSSDFESLSEEDKKTVKYYQENYSNVLASIKDDNFNLHGTQDANSSEYIYFDLYFRIASTGIDPTNPKMYDLRFNSGTEIKTTSDATEVVLTNTCRDVEKTYKTNDIVKVKNEDAMRLAVVEEKEEKEGKSNSITVFEPNYGRGSSAIEDISYNGSSDKKDKLEYDYNLYHDKNYNLMYTYYNSTNPTAYFIKAADNNESFDTLHSFTEKNLGTFTPIYANENNKKTYSYNTIKLTFVLWLEGWDADYIFGVEANEISVKLKFEITESNNN